MNTEEDWNIIQEELNDLEDWGSRNGVEFKVVHCKVMHLRTNEKNQLWTVGSSVWSDRKKNHLVVTVNHRITMNHQCTEKENMAWRYIEQNIFNEARSVFMSVTKVLIRHHPKFQIPMVKV